MLVESDGIGIAALDLTTNRKRDMIASDGIDRDSEVCSPGDAMKQVFTASVYREDHWVIAQCLEIDVASQGETDQEALANLREALELYFESPMPTAVPAVWPIPPQIP